VRARRIVVALLALALFRSPALARNLVYNASFENTTNRGIPDGYHRRLGGLERIRYPSLTLKDFGVVERGAFHGRRCMRLSKNVYLEIANKPLVKGATYTFSAYAKAERDETRVAIGCHGGGVRTKKFTVGTHWRRLHVTFKAPRSRLTLWLRNDGEGAVFWDALQLERADEPTPYSDPPPSERELVRAKGKGPEVPRYDAARAEAPPKIDGVFDDECWKSARVIRIPGRKDKRADTTARIACDDAAVYFAVTCNEPAMDKILARFTKHDELVYSDDSIELFIDPQNDLRRSYHFMLNSLGAKAEERGRRWDWDGPWEAAVRRFADRWTAEVAIPFIALDEGRDFAETWSVNICRSRSHAKEYIPWHGAYHKPWTFPDLRGVRPGRMKLRPGPLAVRLGEKPGTLEVSFVVRNKGDSPVRLKPQLAVRFDESPKTRTIDADGATVPAKGKVAFTFLVPYSPKNEKVRAQGTARSPDGRKVFYTPEKPFELAALLGGPGPEYELYTTEKEMNCKFDLGRARKLEDGRLEIKVTDLSGKRRWEKRAALECDVYRTAIPLERLPNGTYRLTARVLRGEREALARSILFRKLPHPRKGTVVKVNRFRRCLVIDGKPFVGYGTAGSGNRRPEIARAHYKHLKSLGCNTLLLFHCGFGFPDAAGGRRKVDLDALGVSLDIVHEYGMKAAVDLGEFVSTRRRKFTNAEGIEYLCAVVERFRTHPALLNWDLVDEPSPQHEPLDRIEVIYRLIRQIDPYHPVTLNVNVGPARFLPWKTVSDIPSIDMYPVPQESAGTIADGAAGMERFAPYRPIRFWLQSFCGSGFELREPTPHELLAMANMAAVHGTNIFLYFIYPPKSPDLLDMWAQIHREFSQIEDALTAADRRSVALEPDDAPIHASLRIVGREAVLLTVNKSEKAQEVTIVLPEPIRADKADVLFEKRAVAAPGGRIHDKFKPLERHVYRLVLR